MKVYGEHKKLARQAFRRSEPCRLSQLESQFLTCNQFSSFDRAAQGACYPAHAPSSFERAPAVKSALRAALSDIIASVTNG
jgi:hypothetical protein